MRASRWTVLVAALIVAGILGLAIGTIRLSPSQVWDGLRGIGDSAFIVRGLRLPRVVLAALVGAVLAVSIGLASAFVPLAAFAGAIVAVAAAFVVARAAGARGDPRILLMAGVVVGAFANAAIMV